jgi:hypothetical protein
MVHQGNVQDPKVYFYPGLADGTTLDLATEQHISFYVKATAEGG